MFTITPSYFSLVYWFYGGKTKSSVQQITDENVTPPPLPSKGTATTITATNKTFESKEYKFYFCRNRLCPVTWRGRMRGKMTRLVLNMAPISRLFNLENNEPLGWEKTKQKQQQKTNQPTNKQTTKTKNKPHTKKKEKKKVLWARLHEG